VKILTVAGETDEGLIILIRAATRLMRAGSTVTTVRVLRGAITVFSLDDRYSGMVRKLMAPCYLKFTSLV
jgi:hypothetical protein